MAETSAELAKYCYRQLPRASVDICDICGRGEKGRCEIMRKTEEIDLNGRNQGRIGEILLPSASASFRGRPWESATCVVARRKTGDGRQ